MNCLLIKTMNQNQTLNAVTSLLLVVALPLLTKYGVTGDSLTAIARDIFELGALLAPILAHFMHKTTPQAKSEANKPTNSTGTTLGIILAVFTLAFAVGCASNPPTVIYKTIGTTDATVTAAVKAWDIYVSQNPVPINQQLSVRSAFLKMQAAEKLVLDGDAVYAAYGTTNAPPGVLAALAADQSAFNDALADLTAMLGQFNIKL